MTSMTATKARAELYRLLEQVGETHIPVEIKGKRGSAVLIAEEDWRSIQETLHLLSVPGMRESIRQGMDTPLEDCSEALDW